MISKTKGKSKEIPTYVKHIGELMVKGRNIIKYPIHRLRNRGTRYFVAVLKDNSVYEGVQSIWKLRENPELLYIKTLGKHAVPVTIDMYRGLMSFKNKAEYIDKFKNYG